VDTFPRQSPSRGLTITSTLLGAGYETTATSLGWILFELATHPEEQRRLRDEIYSVRAADHFNDIATVNFDEFPFLNAVIKVNLPYVY
jgi:cytochrome P450